MLQLVAEWALEMFGVFLISARKTVEVKLFNYLIHK